MSQLYFALATIIFIIAQYQVDLARRVLIQNDERSFKGQIAAFRAGCIVGRTFAFNVDCDSETQTFRNELERYYQ